MRLHELVVAYIEKTGMDTDRRQADEFVYFRIEPDWEEPTWEEATERPDGPADNATIETRPRGIRYEPKAAATAMRRLLDEADWKQWQRNCRILKYLANPKRKPASTELTAAVQEVIDDTINRMAVEFIYPEGLSLVSKRSSGSVSGGEDKFSGFTSVDEFWMFVFASLLAPEVIRLPGFCSECGVDMKTKKRGQPSGETYCPRCRVRAAENDPDWYEKQKAAKATAARKSSTKKGKRNDS